MTESITLRQHIDAPPDKVFEALTSTAAFWTVRTVRGDAWRGSP